MMASGNEIQLSLHDAIAIGQFEDGLPTDDAQHEDEIHRLPILLRLLAQARPQVRVGVIGVVDSDEDNDDNDTELQHVVQCLEDRAAVYSMSESVEVVAGHLAPHVCKQLAKVPPLQKLEASATIVSDVVATYPQYNVRGLQEWAAQHSWNAQRERKLAALASPGRSGGGGDGGEPGAAAAEHDLEDEALSEMEDTDETEATSQQHVPRSKAKRISTTSATVALVLDEDSTQAMVSKTLSEMVDLVLAALKPWTYGEGDTPAPGKGGSGDNRSDNPTSKRMPSTTLPTNFVLSVEDSILAEPRSSRLDSGRADVGAILAAVLYSAPVLRHDHVAWALCRAAVPQTPPFVAQLGANAPTAVPSLLQGCLVSYRQARCFGVASVAHAAEQAVLALANLSEREAGRVQMMLQREQLLFGVQLELAVKNSRNITPTALLLLHHLRGPVYPQELLQTQRHYHVSGEALLSNSASVGPSRTLKDIISRNDKLHRRTCFRLQTEVELHAKTGSENGLVWGKITILLSALIVLLVEVPSVTAQHSTALFASLITLATQLRTRASTCNDDKGDFDPVLHLLVASYLAVLLSSETATTDTWSQLLALLDNASFSNVSQDLTWQVSLAISHGDAQSLSEMVASALCIDGGNRSWSADIIARMQHAMEVIDAAAVPVSANCDGCAPDRHAALMRILLRSSRLEFDEKKRLLRQLLWDALHDTDKAKAMLSCKACLQTTLDATSLIHSGKNCDVPLIFSSQLEFAAGQARNLRQGDGIDGAMAQLLLQLLYAFTFESIATDCPFKFDFQSLPLGEVLDVCSTAQTIQSDTIDYLREHIEAMLPIMLNWEKFRRPNMWLAVADTEVTSEQLFSVLRSSLIESDRDDSDGRFAEEAWLSAAQTLPDTVLFPVTVSALLTRRHQPPSYITYKALSCDPLVLLQCPGAVWLRPGWRRILLYILQKLLWCNDRSVRRESPDASVAREILLVRDSIIIRTLLAVNLRLSRGDGNKFTSDIAGCLATLGLLRQLVEVNDAIVALLVKQGISVELMSYLIKHVPESVSEANHLQEMLAASDRGARWMSAIERLRTADALFQICVLHARQDSWEVQGPSIDQCVYMALTQIINAFFVIVGPTGMPVTALRDASSSDSLSPARSATQQARVHALRILGNVHHVRFFHAKVRHECVTFLQKLAGLCKGEAIISGSGSGFQSQQQFRHKAYIKELLDATQKAAHSIGAALHV